MHLHLFFPNIFFCSPLTAKFVRVLFGFPGYSIIKLPLILGRDSGRHILLRRSFLRSFYLFIAHFFIYYRPFASVALFDLHSFVSYVLVGKSG